MMPKRILLAVALGSMAIIAPLIAPNDYIVGTLARICLYATLALGLNIVVGFAGLLDIGYVAFFGIGSYIYALLCSPHFGLHLPFLLALPIVVVATALCGLAPGYALLLLARVVAGLFGGVLGGLTFAIVADLVPYERRASATAIVAAAFSLSAVAGVPISLWIAAHFSWRAPFLALAAFSAVVALVAMRLIPPLAAHVSAGGPRGPLAQVRAIFTVPNHLRSFAFMTLLMGSVFTVIPFIAAYNVANVGVAEADLAVIYFAGGATTLVTAQVIGRLADRYGKERLFTILGLISIVPILITTHMPPLPLAEVVALSVLFFVFVPGRFGPATALVTGSVEPRLRGSFMTFNASIQQLASGFASLAAGLIVGRAFDGALTNFGAVGWLSAICTVACLWLVRRIRIVDAGSAKASS